MTLNEVWNMSYDEYVQYLLDKYGKATVDYFCTPECKSKNPKISRTKEGLECHHIDEDKFILLSNPKVACICPFELQKADRLLYADKIEHLILHIKIAEMGEAGGYGCGTKLIIGNINTLFDTPPISGWQLNMYNKIKPNFDLYIEILNRLASQINNTLDIRKIILEQDETKKEKIMYSVSILFATDPNNPTAKFPTKIFEAFLKHKPQEDYEFV